jgi:hypothetical protein
VHDTRHSLLPLTRAELIKDESPLYLFDSQFGEKVPALLEEYQVHGTTHGTHGTHDTDTRRTVRPMRC